MRVYLAGPINGCTDESVFGWREEVTQQLAIRGIEVVSPAHTDFRGREEENARAIVEGDKAAIDNCDAVLAYCWKPSAGTSMEILYAWGNHKNVVACVESSASPWIAYHATVVHSLPDAVEVLAGWR